MANDNNEQFHAGQIEARVNMLEKNVEAFWVKLEKIDTNLAELKLIVLGSRGRPCDEHAVCTDRIGKLERLATYSRGYSKGMLAAVTAIASMFGAGLTLLVDYAKK